MQERLELFVQVCEAIRHAHQKGVLHRDIKPSNVLIVRHDGAARPVVIDFGIARALNVGEGADEGVMTVLGQMIGTPEYMSPEQAGGGSISTRARCLRAGHSPVPAFDRHNAVLEADLGREIARGTPAADLRAGSAETVGTFAAGKDN